MLRVPFDPAAWPFVGGALLLAVIARFVGGWPWASNDPVHAREEGRFARRPDGKTERPA